jgi:hypothetical protein
MGAACNIRERNKKYVQVHDRKKLKGKDNLEDLGTDERIQLKWV